MRKLRKTGTSAREIGRVHGESSTVIVSSHRGQKSFRFAENDGLIQGVMHGDHPLDFRSEYLGGQLAAAVCHPSPQRALCLGLGLGATPRLLHALFAGLQIDCVEANDAVIQAAYTYFDLPKRDDLVVIHDRAEHFVAHRALDTKYDLIFLDCYDANGVALACTSDPFFEHIITLLSPGALLVLNLIPGRVGVDRLRAQAVKRLKSPWIISCPKKSNQTLFGAVSAPLDLEGVVDRARGIDIHVAVPFRIEEELKRGYPII